LDRWSKILLKPEDTLETAINILQTSGARIALVVNDNGKLIGTITDGDIRRALIKHEAMGSAVTNLMNGHPTTVLRSEKRDDIIAKMKKLNFLHIPIVDEQGILKGLETLHNFFEDTVYDNTVFLLAGGFGTRLYPLTKTTPKPLLKVGDQPILETIIRQLIDAGFHNFVISTHYKSEMIRKHFGDGSKWGVNLQYVQEDFPLGTAGSLGLLPKEMTKLPVLIMNGDLLTKINFENLMTFHNEQGGIATMCVKKYDFQVPYGVIETDNHRIISIIEKPVHKFLVNAGIYVLNNSLVRKIDGKSYLDMPLLLENQIKKNEQVNIFPIHEYWLDIGQIDEYDRANIDFSAVESSRLKDNPSFKPRNE
jgi:dTDP-glucose pyrophosphorylase